MKRSTSSAWWGRAVVTLLMVSAILAACDSGEVADDADATTTSQAATTSTSTSSSPRSTTSTTTTSTTTTTLPPNLEPATVRDYLLIVLRAARDSGVNEATAALLATPSEQAYTELLDAVRSNLDLLERVVPPPEAEPFHALLVDQAIGAVSLYEELVEAIAAGDIERIEELAGESLSSFGGLAEIGALQLELLEIALEGRTDAVASYVLAASELGTRIGSDLEGFIDRLDEVLAGEQDLELLAQVADEEAALLLSLAEEFGELHPPQPGARYHVAQLRASGGVGEALARMAAAIRADDGEAFQASSQSLFGFIASGTAALEAQQELHIAALEGVVEEEGDITWARVPVEGNNTFGFVQDVVVAPTGLVVLGSQRFESGDGVVWFTAADGGDLFGTTIVSGLPFDDGLLAVGSVRDESSRNAAVWRWLHEGTWERIGEESLATDGDEAMTDLAAGPSQFVAIGRAGAAGADDAAVGAIWSSQDLDSWQRVEFPEGVDGPDVLRAVAYGGGRFVTVGADVWTSTNGTDWVRADIAGVQALANVQYTSVGFVALGLGTDEEVMILSSPDGDDWTRSSAGQLPDEFASLRDVAQLGDRLYAIGSGETVSGPPELVIWQSTDGASWASVALPSDGFGDRASPAAITAGGPGLVIVGMGPGGATAWIGFVP